MDGQCQPFVVHHHAGDIAQFPFQQPGHLGQGLLKGRGLRVHEVHPPAPHLQTMIAGVDQAGDRHHRLQVGQAPAADHADDEPVHPGQFQERSAGFAGQDRIFGAGDDGRQCAVIVEQQEGSGGAGQSAHHAGPDVEEMGH